MLIGSWRIQKDTSIEDVLRRTCEAWYKPRPVIACVLRNGNVIPRQMLPAGLPESWRVEAEMLAKGSK